MGDEQQIRDVIARWHSAKTVGDVDTVLSLMADDAVFLVAGKPPMKGRSTFDTGRKSVALGSVTPTFHYGTLSNIADRACGSMDAIALGELCGSSKRDPAAITASAKEIPKPVKDKNLRLRAKDSIAIWCVF